MTDRASTWHAVALSRKVGTRPHRVMLDGQPFVLFRSGKALHCLTDRCPHRFAPLSQGRVIDDAIECPYHGWRFDGGGRCRSMPRNCAPSSSTTSICAAPSATR